eukprot:12213785-Alexandrium_andersonii.AAC.1
MRVRHRRGIARALGLADDDERVWLVDTADWSPFPRGRLFFSTLPTAAARFRPRPIEAPWEP